MMDYALYSLVAAGALVTYLIRVSFLLAMGRGRVSPLVEEVLRYIPPAAFAALAVPAVLSPSGTLALGLDNLRLVAAVLALAAGMRTGSVMWTLATGMVALWALTILTG
jgi:branched-subunit amino acid transport protein